ncbi:MAG: LamG domain-containing protein, partial [Bacteroidales bacterium]|nr:LamG domain-containing protein [Bacteroidales bacterium]
MKNFNRNINSSSGKGIITFLSAFIAYFCIAFISKAQSSIDVYSSFGYRYQKTISVDETQVAGGTHNDFPVLISMQDNDLRHVSQGGHVENINGYDIIVTYGGFRLTHQIDSYDPTSGQFNAWVVVDISSSGSYTGYLRYGNPAISTDPSDPSIWPSEYGAVYHMNNANDATSRNNDGTNYGAQVVEDNIGNSMRFVYTAGVESDSIVIPDNNSLEPSQFTISCWFKRDGAQIQWAKMLSKGDLNDPFASYTLQFEDADLYLSDRVSVQSAKTGGAGNFDKARSNDNEISNDTWYYMAGTYTSATNTIEIFINGVSRESSNLVALPIQYYNPADHNLYLGNDEAGNGIDADGYYPFNGYLDEVRIQSTPRSANWLLTEYRNQSDPATFFNPPSAESNHSTYDIADVCRYTAYTYTVPDLWTTYQWIVTGGGTIESGQGTESVNVSWSSNGTIALRVDNTHTSPALTVTTSSIDDADAGSDQELCNTLVATLNGNDPSVGTGTWTQQSGPGTITFGDDNVYNTNATANAYGTYVLRWTIVYNGCTTEDEVTISYAEAAAAGTDQDICGSLAATLAGNDPTIGTGTWSQQSGPGTVTFDNENVFNTTATASAYGTYVLEWD